MYGIDMSIFVPQLPQNFKIKILNITVELPSFYISLFWTVHPSAQFLRVYENVIFSHYCRERSHNVKL